MAEFTVYTKKNCPHCTAAKALLKTLGHTLVEKDTENEDLFKELKEIAPEAMTVPQIFVKSYRIGGYDNLLNLHREDMLEMTIDMAS